jgi:hypothetical protein
MYKFAPVISTNKEPGPAKLSPVVPSTGAPAPVITTTSLLHTDISFGVWFNARQDHQHQLQGLAFLGRYHIQNQNPQ